MISGVGASHRLVGVENEISTDGTTEDRAKARHNNFVYKQGRECDIEYGQQRAAEQYSTESRKLAMSPEDHVQGTIG